MIDPSLALQIATRSSLVAASALTALVPATNIIDNTDRAARFPSILIGEGQTINEDTTYARDTVRVYLDLHLWDEATDLAGVKMIAGAIRHALRDVTPWAITDHRVVDLVLQTTRFMRDCESDQPLAHGVVTINALLQEVPSLPELTPNIALRWACGLW